MTELPNFPTGGPSAPPARKSRLIAMALTIFCGALLAVTSCFGFIGTLNNNGSNKPLNTMFSWGIVAGIVAFLAGVIWAIVAFVLHVIRHRS